MCNEYIIKLSELLGEKLKQNIFSVEYWQVINT